MIEPNYMAPKGGLSVLEARSSAMFITAESVLLKLYGKFGLRRAARTHAWTIPPQYPHTTDFSPCFASLLICLY